MKFRIDNQEMELESPVSILEAARRIGIEIPALCYQGGMEHFTSCMICVVKEKKSGRLLPACSAPVAEGMEIETGNDEVRAFRKSTLELLLSDHVGDCEAPCQRLCPLHMEIPRMIRETLGGRLEDAIQTVRRDIAIPSILERFCNVPCERGCRRGKHDEPISIRQLTRHAADWDLRRDQQLPLAYDKVDWKVWTHPDGDSFARCWIRLQETREATKIVDQLLDGIPSGPIMAKVPRIIKVPEGEAWVSTENPLGEMGYYVVSRGDLGPFRVKIRSASFNNISITPWLLKGVLVPDIITILSPLTAAHTTKVKGIQIITNPYGPNLDTVYMTK